MGQLPGNQTPALHRLIQSFQKLPGIGPKSAQRLAFFILKQPKNLAAEFSDALIDAKEHISLCETCFNFATGLQCDICLNTNRKTDQICIVSEPQDLFAIERTGDYKGLYHVLQGLISPMEGVGPDDLKIQALVSRLSDVPLGQPMEVILALPPSIEGDTTSLYLTRLLKPVGITISRIAFGLPVGGDLEYADTLTLTRALSGRQLVD